jgi:hypothetical protein
MVIADSNFNWITCEKYVQIIKIKTKSKKNHSRKPFRNMERADDRGRGLHLK